MSVTPIPRQRQRLTDRRTHETLNLAFGGQRFSLGIGRFDDGSPAEAFVTSTKCGSTYDSLARDAGILLSIALQSGADLQTIARALTRDNSGAPASILGALVDVVTEATE